MQGGYPQLAYPDLQPVQVADQPVIMPVSQISQPQEQYQVASQPVIMPVAQISQPQEQQPLLNQQQQMYLQALQNPQLSGMNGYVMPAYADIAKPIKPKQIKPAGYYPSLNGATGSGKLETRQIGAQVFVVHQVNPTFDTLFKISYHYKVSKKDIRTANQFSGDEIFTFLELLIPINDQNNNEVEPMVRDMNEGQQKIDEEKRRKISTDMLAEAIMLIEKKHVVQRRLLAKLQNTKFEEVNLHNDMQKFIPEALYYLGETEWDYTNAFAQYKEDLQLELNMIPMLKAQKNSKFSGIDNPQQQGCCTIF